MINVSESMDQKSYFGFSFRLVPTYGNMMHSFSMQNHPTVSDAGTTRKESRVGRGVSILCSNRRLTWRYCTIYTTKISTVAPTPDPPVSESTWNRSPVGGGLVTGEGGEDGHPSGLVGSP